MKRLLLAVILALGMHAILFKVDFRWINKVIPTRPRPRLLSMTLTYYQPEKPKSKSVITKPVIPPEKPVHPKKKVKKKKPKRILKPKPIKKASKSTKTHKEPAQTEKKSPPKPEPLPEPEETESVEEPDYPDATNTEEVIHEKVLNVADKNKSTPDLRTVREATPLYRKNPPPKYPRIARKRGYQGTVILEVLVGRDGNVAGLRLFKSSGYTVLDKVAMASVKDWLFKPGMRGDVKVEMWVKVPIRFQLK